MPRRPGTILPRPGGQPCHCTSGSPFEQQGRRERRDPRAWPRPYRRDCRKPSIRHACPTFRCCSTASCRASSSMRSPRSISSVGRTRADGDHLAGVEGCRRRSMVLGLRSEADACSLSSPPRRVGRDGIWATASRACKRAESAVFVGSIAWRVSRHIDSMPASMRGSWTPVIARAAAAQKVGPSPDARASAVSPLRHWRVALRTAGGASPSREAARIQRPDRRTCPRQIPCRPRTHCRRVT